MDSLFPLLAALALALVITVPPLVTVLRSAEALRLARTRVPESSRPSPPEDLTPLHLGYLAGGAVRTAEVALMEARLHGRVCAPTRDGFLALVGPDEPRTSEKEKIRRDIVRAFRGRAAIGGRELMRHAVASRGIDRVRSQLHARRLIVDSPELRASLAARARLRGVFLRLFAVALVAVVTGFCLDVSAVASGGWGTALLTGGITTGAVVAFTRLALGLSGGLRPSVNTPAGDAVLAESAERYPASETMDTDHALRHTALAGFRALRLAASPWSRSREAAAQDMAAAPSETCALGAVHRFAEVCQGPFGPRRGAPYAGVDGWGRGFADVGAGIAAAPTSAVR
ncbi:TIGR04222 domain-containing membrane protein [Nocardiopsis sp. LOL_012]|uniref:TIGR04222 domain-containing membrane protein n=1 Tax=Nocardiopsis sp. LOL_012 TaxID=3345409 RepID=UPI003A868E2C